MEFNGWHHKSPEFQRCIAQVARDPGARASFSLAPVGRRGDVTRRDRACFCAGACVLLRGPDREPARCSSSFGCIRGVSSVPGVLILQLLFALLWSSGMQPREGPFPSSPTRRIRAALCVCAAGRAAGTPDRRAGARAFVLHVAPSTLSRLDRWCQTHDCGEAYWETTNFVVCIDEAYQVHFVRTSVLDSLGDSWNMIFTLSRSGANWKWGCIKWSHLECGRWFSKCTTAHTCNSTSTSEEEEDTVSLRRKAYDVFSEVLWVVGLL